MPRLSKLTKHCLAALSLSTVALTANAGEIAGQLTNDDNSRVFAGAQIKLQELNLTTESRRDGTFRFTALPAGTYTLQISYLGAKPVTEVVSVSEDGVVTPVISLSDNGKAIADILVKGQRSSQASTG